MRDVAEADAGVWSLDLDAVACPYLPMCDPIVRGLVVRRDHNHLTTRFANEVVRDPVDRFLMDNDILD